MYVDARRNMFILDYYLALLKALLKGRCYSRSGSVSKILRLPDRIKNVIEAVDNWHEAILGYPLLVLRRRPLKIRLRDGIVEMAVNRGDIAKIVKGFRVRQALMKVKRLYNVDLSFLSREPTFLEVFYYESYKVLDVREKIVIDVGAYVGDTTIYFLLKGARRVIAIEPNPTAIRIAAENVKRLGLESRVTLVNAAIGGVRRRVLVAPNVSLTPRADLGALVSSEGVSVDVITLKDVVETYGIDEAVLKMDCEGCEYESILSEDDSVLKAFKEMIIEYHYGYRNLVKRLKYAGFKVKWTRPTYIFDKDSSNPHKFLGLIYAVLRF